MIEWTTGAKMELEGYCHRARLPVEQSGADATEVFEDLRRHIDTEAATTMLRVVTADDVRRILSRMGDPIPPTGENGEAPQSAMPIQDSSSRPRSVAPLWPLILGVILPAISFGVELTTHICAATCFDPLPTWWHVMLVGLVIVSNGLLWYAGRQPRWNHYRTLSGWLNGVAIGVAGFYALLYLPLLPFGLIGLAYFGLGVLPMAPLMALISAWYLRWREREISGFVRPHLTGFWPGLAIGVLSLLLLEAPDWIAQYGMQMAVSESPGTQARGIRWLRAVGSEGRILRACYERPPRITDFITLIMNGRNARGAVTQEEARQIYYRVTGQPFNAVPPPKLYTRAGQWNWLEDQFAWDRDTGLGGDAVAGRVKGLSLASSRIDGTIDAEAAIAYVQWSMEFKNVATVQREARAQIALPPGAVVSRLTLWVNGEAREAAFAGRGQVREAYQKVAVEQRRDPVLVTTSGPDRILVQCFPIPPNGGRMKIRLGLTIPLVLEAAARGHFQWPLMVERNFALNGDLKHSVWIQSTETLAATSTALKPEHPKPELFALRGELSDSELVLAHTRIQVTRDARVQALWMPLEPGFGLVRQRVMESEMAVPTRVALVVDSSRNMRDHYDAIRKVLPQAAPNLELALFVAQEGGLKTIGSPPRAAKRRAEIEHDLRSLKAVGGQDNIPALVAALDWAAERTNSAVLWIHGPQPVLLSEVERLRQSLESHTDSPKLFDLQTGIGPNRIIEQMDRLPTIHSVPRQGTLVEDLTQWFRRWQGKQRVFELVRDYLKADSIIAEPSVRQTSNKHLLKLWAKEEVLRLLAQRQTTQAIELARQHQIVTPVSGAVVLETKQQYDQAGLTPAAPETVPVIPEPQTWLLLILGLGMVVLFRMFRRY